LKCQDIFSVHGFPVGLIPCEASLLGTERVGSGGFRHFVRKYVRAKQYCSAPFETRWAGRRKKRIQMTGEMINAPFTPMLPKGDIQAVALRAANAVEFPLEPSSLDGVFTDPPYFDNVQYAELMDFCYVWLRLGLKDEFGEFRGTTTRSANELTGNHTSGRGLEHFAGGLSAVFSHYARALKPDAPFVFTYHHNNPSAYAPVVVAILDSGLSCTATLPAAAEMSASLHIARTGSSRLDSVFVCRLGTRAPAKEQVESALRRDAEAMVSAGVNLSIGDLRCLLAGHMARSVVGRLRHGWNDAAGISEKLAAARGSLERLADELTPEDLAQRVLEPPRVSWRPSWLSPGRCRDG